MYQQQLDRFANHLLVKRGLGAVTIHGYHGGMRRFFSHTNKLIPTETHIAKYITMFHAKKYSYSYIVNTSLAIERYMEFLGKPIKLGKPRKPKRTIMDTMSEAEIARLLGATKSIREKALISLVAYSGVRSRELCNLKVSDINFASSSILVRSGKGNKDRIVCVASECLDLVQRYVQTYPRSYADFLFSTLKRQRQYQTGDLRKLIRVVAARAGLERRIYPHLLRHSLATNMLNRGANLITIQQQLGHAFIETTMVYLHPSLRRTRSEYLMYAPNYI